MTVEFSHLAINRPERWGTGDELLEMFERARADGVDIVFDVYPYDASSSSLTQYLPPWVQEGGTEEMRRRLADAGERRRTLAEMTAGWFNGIPWLWDRFVVSSTPDGALVGQTLAEAADALHLPPDELTLRLCEEYGNEIQVVLFYRTEEDVASFLRHPLGVIGSDGNAIPLEQASAKPHPRSFGTFPRVLGRYVRDGAVLELPDAIRKMTSEPARRLGIRDRGSVEVGKFADLVLFDPATVADQATFEQPANAPLGISHVMVNGTLALDDERADRAPAGDRAATRVMTATTRPLRVAVLGFHHESNTFAPVPASLDRWLAGGVTEGDEIVDRYGSSQATMAGFLEMRHREDVECTPLIHADLNPMGTITEEAFEHLVRRMIDALVDNGPWDVVLLALHGAAVASHQLDADGEIISRVRAVVGPDVVIGVALDMHANVSRRMMHECDVLNTYLTNPHIDARQRAREVADLALATAAGSDPAGHGDRDPAARHRHPAAGHRATRRCAS